MPATVRKKQVFLTTADICYLYQVVPMTVWEWRKKKGMPFLTLSSGKFGSKAPVRFNLDLVLTWCEQRLGRRPDEDRLAEYLT